MLDGETPVESDITVNIDGDTYTKSLLATSNPYYSNLRVSQTPLVHSSITITIENPSGSTIGLHGVLMKGVWAKYNWITGG